MQLKILYRKDQSLPELAHTMRTLTRQAYPEATQATRETLARNHFIDALPDAEVRWGIQQTRLKSLKDALTTAVELEAFQMANIQHTTQSSHQSSSAPCSDCRGCKSWGRRARSLGEEAGHND